MTPGELVITTDRVGVFPSVLDGGRNMTPPLVGNSTIADVETRDPRVHATAEGATRWQVDGKYLARGSVKRVSERGGPDLESTVAAKVFWAAAGEARARGGARAGRREGERCR